MADTMKVPVFGSQKKTTVYLFTGGAVIVLGVGYYRAKKARDAAALTSGPGIDSTQIDQATGFAYGSAQDAAALAAQQAYQTPTTGGGGGGGVIGTGQTSVTQFVSNAQWAQAAEDYLIHVIQAPAAEVSAAMGKYLTGQPVTPAQHSYIEQAIAAEGLPPVGGVNGYPPSIKTGAPAAKPPTHPYKTVAGDTLVSIATTHYGAVNAKNMVQAIRNLNPTFKAYPQRSKLPVGVTLQLP